MNETKVYGSRSLFQQGLAGESAIFYTMSVITLILCLSFVRAVAAAETVMIIVVAVVAVDRVKAKGKMLLLMEKID